VLRAISICRIQCYVREFLNLSDRVFRFGYLPEAAKLLGLTIIGDINMWVLN